MKKILFLTVILNTLFHYAIALASTHDQAIKAYWVEMQANNQISARVITSQPQCPTLQINGRSYKMRKRASKNIPEFPVTTCERVLPNTANNIRLNEHSLPLTTLNPQRIIVLGDTGCRLKKHRPTQTCNDPQQWPFASIAAEAASWKPDLVIHVGDYLYRETACPAGNVGCQHGVYGDNWPTWSADFFIPAEKLLRAAPWTMVRGNHENCSRAYKGWFRFLDPYPYSEPCRSHTPPYTVSLNAIDLVIMDSTIANDLFAPSKEVDLFKKDFQKIPGPKPVWLLSHKPVWAFTSLLNNTLQVAALNNLPPNVQLILSGHIHHFQTLNFYDNRPPQVIVGTGGTQLDVKSIYPLLNALKSGGAAPTKDTLISRFGYLLLENTSEGWQGYFYGVGKKLLATCQLKNNYFICNSPRNPATTANSEKPGKEVATLSQSKI